MAKTIYPFSLYRRGGSPYYSVKFRLPTGGYSKVRSTGKADRDEAIKVALGWLASGEHLKDAKTIAKEKKKAELRSALISDEDLMLAVEELKRRGAIKGVILKDTPEARNAYLYALDFWDWEKSDYIAEKLRQNHSMHKHHARQCRAHVERFWKKHVGNKMLAEVRRSDIDRAIRELFESPLAGHSKNAIIRSFTVALKWAFNHEEIPKDITKGIVFFSEKSREREILTPEMARAIFSVEWKDERARLANVVAMLTGMRSGEIRALKPRDIGENCIYVRHSWNDEEGLKCPKNGEERTVQIPFDSVISDLAALYEKNPFREGADEFIFYSTMPHKPIDADILIDGLRDALTKIGLKEETAKKYTFHAWRHFFATYMGGKVETKLLQMQTGHKTKMMLEHYQSHERDTDAQAIRAAQVDVFAPMLGERQKND